MPRPKSSKLTKKQAEWLKYLQGWIASGRTLAAYARSQGLQPQQFYAWRSRLRSAGITVPAAAVVTRPLSVVKSLPAPGRRQPGLPGFVTARVTPDALAPLNSGVQIRFPNGIVVEVRTPDAALPDAQILTQLAALP